MNSLLTKEALEQLTTTLVPQLSPPQQDNYQQLAAQLGKSWAEADKLRDSVAGKLAGYQAGAADAQVDLDLAEHDVAIIKRWLKKNPRLDYKSGRFDQVLSRVRVKLADATRLPLIWGWAKLFAIPEHPLLTPFLDIQSEAKLNLADEIKKVEIKTTKVQEWLKPRLAQAEGRLQDDSHRTLNYLDAAVVADINLAPAYLRVVPDQAEAIARRYIEQNLLQPHLLENFAEFISHVKALARTPQDIQAARRRYGAYLEAEEMILAEAAFGNLNPSAQRRFKEYLVFKIMTDWAEAGVITQPHIPDVLMAV